MAEAYFTKSCRMIELESPPYSAFHSSRSLMSIGSVSLLEEFARRRTEDQGKSSYPGDPIGYLSGILTRICG